MDPALVAGLASGLAVLSWWAPVTARLAVGELPSGVNAEVARQRRRRLTSAVATGLAVGLASSSFGWLGLVIGVAAAASSYAILGRLVSAAEEKRQSQLAADLPQACDLLVVCLEAGLPLRAAAELVGQSLSGPMSAELLEVAAKARLGIDEHRAWADFGAQPALSRMGRELSRGAASGVSLASRLRALGVDARKTDAAKAETTAKKVGVSSVMPLMVCFLPAFVLVGVVPIIGGMVLKLFG